MEGDRGSANDGNDLFASNGGPKTMSPKAQNHDEDLKSSDPTGAHTPPTAVDGGPPSLSPKKRRKVNHAYDMRSGEPNHLLRLEQQQARLRLHHSTDADGVGLTQERPCTRCIKRNIGHLCHDEPREQAKRPKSEHHDSTGEDETSLKHEDPPANGIPQTFTQQQTDQPLLPESGLRLGPNRPVLNRIIDPPRPVAPTLGPGNQVQASKNGAQYHKGYNAWSLGSQNQFQDMHNFHPSYMFNAPEVTNEYNLLNDFLSTSLLDDGAMYSGDDVQGLYSDPALINSVAANWTSVNGQILPNQQQNQILPHPQSSNVQGSTISRPASAAPIDKAREMYYMTAADPAGTDTPEERMNKLLKAKYDAGMLKPFNYVKGYARLNQYMEQHMQPTSRQKILRQLDKFRPKFRERMQTLTDIELVLVEMWFERSLMEYDRVFASMAIPACCWRRTGEIFRGNMEMAELIHVPIEKLRDGKLAIHEIIVEDQLVSYWEKFGAIAFDSSQKAMLTSCTLKNPNLDSVDPEIHCCFSFTIRRDSHNIPSLIIGNFLPTKVTKR